MNSKEIRHKIYKFIDTEIKQTTEEQRFELKKLLKKLGSYLNSVYLEEKNILQKKVDLLQKKLDKKPKNMAKKEKKLQNFNYDFLDKS